MRPLLRTWILLPIIAIIIVVGMFWAREQAREAKKDPLVKAQEGIEKSFGMKLETKTSSGSGLKVLAVRPGSPADKTGIKAGDVVVALGERSVWHVYQFADLMSKQLQAMPYLPLLVEHKGEYRSFVFGTHAAMQGGAPGMAPPGAGMRGRAPSSPGGAQRAPGGRAPSPAGPTEGF
jgi:hypothetical protein